MYNLLCGTLPYDPGIEEDVNNFLLGEVVFDLPEEEDHEIEVIDGEEYVNPLVFFENVSEEAKDLIRMMLCNDPNKRLTVEKALEHPWFSMYNDSSVLSMDTKEILNALDLCNE